MKKTSHLQKEGQPVLTGPGYVLVQPIELEIHSYDAGQSYVSQFTEQQTGAKISVGTFAVSLSYPVSDHVLPHMKMIDVDEFTVHDDECQPLG